MGQTVFTDDAVHQVLFSGVHGKQDFAGIMHHLGGIQDFEADNPAIIAEVSDDAGTHLVAFLDALLPQGDAEGVGFRVIRNLHGSVGDHHPTTAYSTVRGFSIRLEASRISMPTTFPSLS